MTTERIIERTKIMERVQFKNHDGHFVTIVIEVARTDDRPGTVRLGPPDIAKLEEVIAEFRRDRATLAVYSGERTSDS